MRLNKASANPTTANGAPAKRISPLQQLRRSVMSCLLWENEFYEDGQDIAQRILDLSSQVSTGDIATMAVEARHVHNLRHVPLLLLTALIARGGPGVANAIAATIHRPDEMTELLAIYWRNGRKPLAKQLQKGLAKAFGKFDEYALAKYDRDDPVKLRDVLFLSHAKPETPEREELYKRVASRTLATPDTWEVALSGGANKREAFTRLIQENKLGYLALLRNLRTMMNEGVNKELVENAIIARHGAQRVLPFRYVAAARACPQLEPAIDKALCAAIAEMPALPGKTVVLVDVSGSMEASLSAKSDMLRIDAAAALASVINGDLRVFSFSDRVCEVAPRKGMAGVDLVINSQRHQSTLLGAAVRHVNEKVPHDRIIVITDEQSHDVVPNPVVPLAYMINVASNRNGVGYGKWIHIDGFSESVIRFIHEYESTQ